MIHFPVRFLSLLEKLIGESEFLQNSPPQGLIPKEDRASDHLLKVLAPYCKESGGVLEVERINFVDGRGTYSIGLPTDNHLIEILYSY